METVFFWYLVFCIQFFSHLHNFSKLDFSYPECSPTTSTPPATQSTTEEQTIQ